MAGTRGVLFRLAVTSLALYLASAVHADILHLRDGSRYSGKVVAETADEILFRIESADNKASTIRKFSRELVENIERGVIIHEPVDDDAESDDQPEEPSANTDYEQWLREAFELIDRGDARPALRVLARLARLRDHDLTARLDAACRAARNRPLDEFIAAVRIDTALAGNAEGAIKFAGVTRFESDALGRLLEPRIDELLAHTYEGRSVRDWTVKQAEFTRTTSESPALVRDARTAAALITARLRHDPRLREARDQRATFVALREELARLAARVAALPGFGTESARQPSAADYGPPYLDNPLDGRELFGNDNPPTTSRPASGNR